MDHKLRMFLQVFLVKGSSDEGASISLGWRNGMLRAPYDDGRPPHEKDVDDES